MSKGKKLEEVEMILNKKNKNELLDMIDMMTGGIYPMSVKKDRLIKILLKNYKEVHKI